MSFLFTRSPYAPMSTFTPSVLTSFIRKEFKIVLIPTIEASCPIPYRDGEIAVLSISATIRNSSPIDRE